MEGSKRKRPRKSDGALPLVSGVTRLSYGVLAMRGVGSSGLWPAFMTVGLAAGRGG